jgi:uncharacterized protein YjeT (DUF2065 family)
VYRFTAPRGETSITARAVSQAAVVRLERFGLAALVVVVAFLALRFGGPLVSSSLSHPRAGRTMVLLGILSLATGILPLAGLGLVAAGVVLRVRGSLRADAV